ncbi:SCO family protein, partial [Enterococcus faecium]
KMAEYVKSFHPRLIGLSGTPEEIGAAIKAFRVYARKAPDEKNPEDYTMDHSSVAYLMGPDGKLKSLIGDVTKSDVLARQLREGLAKKG